MLFQMSCKIIFMHSLLIFEESVSPSSGKCWCKMLSRHVLDMHEGLRKEKSVPKIPTQPCDHRLKYRDSLLTTSESVFRFSGSSQAIRHVSRADDSGDLF